MQYVRAAATDDNNRFRQLGTKRHLGISAVWAPKCRC